MSRTSSTTTLKSSVDPADMKQADASASTSWMQLDGIALSKYARGMFAMGMGNAHTRIRSATGAMPEVIYADDSSVASRLGGGLGVSPVMVGPLRPVPYVFYNFNWGPGFTGLTSSLELGVDVELVAPLEKNRASAFVVGFAMLRDSGKAQAELSDIGTYDGTFDSTGFMVTFGWHYFIESFDQ